MKTAINTLVSASLLAAAIVSVSAEAASASPFTSGDSITIDFDEIELQGLEQTSITDQLKDQYGVSFSATKKNGTTPKELWLYNTNCNPFTPLGDLPECTGRDEDLATGTGSYIHNGWEIEYDTPEQGYALIIQENTGRAPDDDAGGGWINFKFDELVNFESIGILDLDDAADPTFELIFGDGTTQIIENLKDSDPRVSFIGTATETKVNNPNKVKEQKNNSLREYSFSAESLQELRVKLDSSGALAHARYQKAASQTRNTAKVPEPGTAIAVVGAGLMLVSTRKKES